MSVFTSQPQSDVVMVEGQKAILYRKEFVKTVRVVLAQLGGHRSVSIGRSEFPTKVFFAKELGLTLTV